MILRLHQIVRQLGFKYVDFHKVAMALAKVSDALQIFAEAALELVRGSAAPAQRHEGRRRIVLEKLVKGFELGKPGGRDNKSPEHPAFVTLAMPGVIANGAVE